MPIDVTLILHFVAVAEELSFRKAAERLQVAQPWLSRQIAKLEAEIGFRLFNRTTRRVELTEKGARLLAKARVLAREVEATRTLGTLLAREAPDRLRIGVPFFALRVRARLKIFQRFRDRHPAVELEMRNGDLRKLHQDLVNGEIDGLFSTGPVDVSGLEVLTLIETGLEAVLNSNDPLLSKASLAVSDLRGKPLVVFPRHTNPGLYDELFGLLEGHAGRLIETAEFRYTNKLDGLNAISIVPGWSPAPARNGVRRPLSGCDSISRFQFIKREDAQTEAMDAFWEIAAHKPPKRGPGERA
ncbi:HTH-type transcriptional regulator BenM [Alphaproteobacteria bacterium SO-S41]|nr:HTH-type transcriptional regulator BenM [Alphaproteobacteria bacterium SO-S41]